MRQVMPWFVYLARCADDTLYCGVTNDVQARLAAHNAGTGARYTRARTPIEFVLVRRCLTKGRALQLEYRVKQLTRQDKERLIADPSLWARARGPARRRPSTRARRRRPAT